MKKIFALLVLLLVPVIAFGSFNYTGGGTYYTQGSVSSTQTTVQLSGFLEPGSNIPYTMSYLNTDIVYATIAPQSAQAEFISFTGITQNANGTAVLTGVSRGLSRSYPYTASSTFAFPHPGQSQLILSTPPQFFNHFLIKGNSQTIDGLFTFTDPPIFVNAATSTAQAASVAYVNGVAFAGAPNASETVKGISELSTAAETGAGTSSGGTGARLVIPTSLATSTPTASCSAFCVVVAAAGKISQSFLDLTQSFTVSGAWVFNNSATFNGAVSLPTGTTINGVVIAPKFGDSGIDGALTLTSGTTTIDLAGATYVEKNYTSISITGTGNLAFSNPAAGGTFIVLKSQGNVTLTCSNGTCIGIQGLGSAGGNGGACAGSSTAGANGTATNPFYLFAVGAGAGGATGAAGAGGITPTAIAPVAPSTASSTLLKYGAQLWTGAGGGGGACNTGGAGSQTGGVGGRGGGGIIIEVGGALNLTATNAVYANGVNGAIGSNSNGGSCAAGGGGGAGGFIKILYGSLTAVSGTVSAGAGTGANNTATCGATTHGGGGGAAAYTAGSAGADSGTLNAKTGGDGAAGYTSVEKNANFF